MGTLQPNLDRKHIPFPMVWSSYITKEALFDSRYILPVHAESFIFQE